MGNIEHFCRVLLYMGLNMSKEFVFESYEGNEPYLFISYSHNDSQSLTAVINVLKTNNIRYWFDNGLHSGDD